MELAVDKTYFSTPISSSLIFCLNWFQSPFSNVSKYLSMYLVNIIFFLYLYIYGKEKIGSDGKTADRCGHSAMKQADSTNHVLNFADP